MASTEHEPISITVSDPRRGTIVVTPGPRAQKRLRRVPAEDLPRVIEAIEGALSIQLKGVCGLIHDEADLRRTRRAAALAALEQADTLHTGGLSGTDNPSGPFQHGAGA